MINNKELFVTRPYLPPRKQFNQYLDEIWNKDQLTNNGALHNQLQTELSRLFDGNSVTLVVNGHLGLDLTLHVLGVKGEVITTAFSFASTTHALTWREITPVFCDVRGSDLTIDPDKIEALITERTTAILPVHVYGYPCDVCRIDGIARKHNLSVIYDAAHAFGVRLDGKSIAGYGDVSMFSFHATKLFHTIEGGALVYEDASLQQAFEACKNFGICDGAYEYTGTNAKMNEFQAAMGLCILPQLEKLIEERKQIVRRYLEHLSEINGIRCLSEMENPHITYNYAYMPILVDANAFGHTRDELFTMLKTQQIYCRRYFYPLISDYSCYAGCFNKTPTPVAAMATEQVLCLPIFNGMEPQDIDRVCTAIMALSC